MKKKNKIIIWILLALAAWFVYFDIKSYINFESTYAKYEKVLRKYRDTKNELDNLEKELKELHLQIANDRNNISQTKSSASP